MSASSQAPKVVGVVEDDLPARTALGRLLLASGFEPVARGSVVRREPVLPPRPRVLLADDYPDILKAISRLLSLDCDIVGTVADGRALLETAQRLQPDVVVLDVHLPNVDSLQACREMTRANPETKVIMFSAMDGLNVSQAYVEAGAAAFISKLKSVDLLATIKRLCVDRG